MDSYMYVCVSDNIILADFLCISIIYFSYI